MGLVAAWREGGAHRERVERYVAELLAEPAAEEVAWLASLTGDLAGAREELRLLRCALGVIVAEQDALADRTAADVAHRLGLPVRAGTPEQRVGWAERWRAYADALAQRGTADPPAHRMAGLLLALAGAPEPSADVLRDAAARVTDLRAALNERLRSVFGQVALPDDVVPSTVRT